MNYFLIGMPGSGKSTLGKQLAAILDFEYVDLDDYIEEKEGKSIPEIFEQLGQDYFRGKETEALTELIGLNKDLLISTGGGAPCFNENMSLINNGGVTIYIDVSTVELFKRLKSGKQNRPLVQGLSEEELISKLEQMKSERTTYYMKALIHLIGDHLTTQDVLNAIKKRSRV